VSDPDGEFPDAGNEDPGIARSGRSALWVGMGILASRLVGLVRQRVLAHYFGDSWIADVFNAAFRLPNITQNLLGEGTLSASFIPVYVQINDAGDAARARTFARDILGLLILTTVAVSSLGALFAAPLTHAIAPGFHGERFTLAVEMVRIFFPTTGLLALSAWSLGVLNSHRRFLLPYIAPAAFSLSQIVGLVGGARFATGAQLMLILGYASFVGAALQILVQLPSVRGLLGTISPRFVRSTADVKRAVRAFGPVVLGRGVVQISAYVDTALASLLPVGANAVMGYVQSIYLLPVSLFGVGAAAAALPEMSAQAADPQAGRARLRQQTGESLTRVAFTTVPATLAFLVVPDQIVGALYQTGRFDASTTAVVAATLAAAGCGLLANTEVRVLATAFYALGDTRTPARLAILRVVTSVGLSYLLMLRFGVVGLAAGSAIGGWFEAALLARMAHRQLEGLGLPGRRWVKILVAAILAAAAGYAVKELFPWNQVLVKAAASLGVFGFAYLGAAWALRLPDVRSPFAAVARRLRR
jgi:putative peptidoglycan lipid II flippase